MSRIGRKPIEIPAGVEVRIEGNTVAVKGPKGDLKQDFHPEMRVSLAEGRILVERPSDERRHRSLHGLTRTLIANMVEGVTKGFSKGLEIEGVGYRAAKSGNKLVLTVGYSHPVEIDPGPGIEFEVPAPARILVKGLDKQRVGEAAAEIRAVRKPEPYLGKGIRYEKERIRRKAGKTGKTAKK
ncbi:MAG: 50S ribosomal protein L6 [Patescibacteria group bacterium]